MPIQRRLRTTKAMNGTENKINYAIHSVPGQVRALNEDSILSCPELGLWVIADGMGGHERGEVASAIVVAAIAESLTLQDSLEVAVHAANQAVIQAAKLDPASKGMGSTVVAVKFSGAEYQLAWVGDSRAYLLSDTDIVPLSQDHSWVQSMIDLGQLTAEEARNHPRKNEITQCLGYESLELEVGLRPGLLQNGQRLLLCSDGLHGELSDQRLFKLAANDELDTAVIALIGAANHAGGKDNISCALLLGQFAAAPVSVLPKSGFWKRLLRIKI
jgi:serine/threonine protein phosphatase PrpC